MGNMRNRRNPGTAGSVGDTSSSGHLFPECFQNLNGRMGTHCHQVKPEQAPPPKNGRTTTTTEGRKGNHYHHEVKPEQAPSPKRGVANATTKGWMGCLSTQSLRSAFGGGILTFKEKTRLEATSPHHCVVVALPLLWVVSVWRFAQSPLGGGLATVTLSFGSWGILSPSLEWRFAGVAFILLHLEIREVVKILEILEIREGMGWVGERREGALL